MNEDKGDKGASLVTEEKKEANLFMVNHESDEFTDSTWIIDSGCSNHMTGARQLFKSLNTSHKQIVRLGDNKEMRAEGKETVVLKAFEGKEKLLHDV